MGVWLCILASLMLGVASLFLFACDGRPCMRRQNARDKQHYPVLPESRSTEVSAALIPQDEGALIGEARREPPVDVSAVEMLSRADFWILMPILVIGQGSGLLWLNNSGQILDAFMGRHMDP